MNANDVLFSLSLTHPSLSQVGDPLAEWTSSSISGSLHKLTLAKLQPDSLYEVEMAAKNCAGLGQPAMMTFRTGKGKTLSEQSWRVCRMYTCCYFLVMLNIDIRMTPLGLIEISFVWITNAFLSIPRSLISCIFASV